MEPARCWHPGKQFRNAVRGCRSSRRSACPAARVRQRAPAREKDGRLCRPRRERSCSCGLRLAQESENIEIRFADFGELKSQRKGKANGEGDGEERGAGIGTERQRHAICRQKADCEY